MQQTKVFQLMKIVAFQMTSDQMAADWMTVYSMNANLMTVDQMDADKELKFHPKFDIFK